MDYQRYNDFYLDTPARQGDRKAMAELECRGEYNEYALNSVRRAHAQTRSGPSWTCRHCGHVNRGTDSRLCCGRCDTPQG
jgi:rubrerythrin